jgi:hypothetical protein
MLHAARHGRGLAAYWMRRDTAPSRVFLSWRVPRRDERASGVNGIRGPECGQLPVNPAWPPVPKKAISCTWGVALSFELLDQSRKAPASIHPISIDRGGSDWEAANASSGRVKNSAEKPFMLSMAARVDAITCSSSTTKTRGTVSECTYVLFRVPFP